MSEFHQIVASDVGRDGLGLELWEGKKQVAEIFRSDREQQMKISLWKQDLPLELVENFIAECASLSVSPRPRTYPAIEPAMAPPSATPLYVFRWKSSPRKARTSPAAVAAPRSAPSVARSFCARVMAVVLEMELRMK